MDAKTQQPMKTSLKSLLLTAVLGLWTSAASAHHIAGTVICTDTIPATPLAGVVVEIVGTAGPTIYTIGTSADGSFLINVPPVTDTYTVTIHPPAGLTIVSPASGNYVVPIFAGGVGGPDHFDTANFSLTGCGTPPRLGRIGDTVYCDANGNGTQDAGEAGIAGVKVTLLCKDGAGNVVATAEATTDANGKYLFIDVPAGVCEVTVDTSSVTGDCNVPVCATKVTVNLALGQVYLNADFCFKQPPQGPGTGTPGYWKNHPSAWPVASIVIGGRTYSKADAIKQMSTPEKGDKTRTVFRHLVSAKLNVLIGNASACIDAAIAQADAWMALHPVGSKVSGSSAAWAEISGTATLLDQYNNGLLCAPHRD
jgi:hypothetical protein